MTNQAFFRFYEELNDFLPPLRRKKKIFYQFNGNPGIKDAIEAMGVPHTEVDLILVNGDSVDFAYHLRDGDKVSVYPVFEAIDISSLSNLRGKPLRQLKFVCDVHLGKLAKKLRMLGFDTLYKNDYSDSTIISIASNENRCVLTRDRGILKNKAVDHGYWVRTKNPFEQVREVISRFDLVSCIQPFILCMECNGTIVKVDKREIIEHLQPQTLLYYEDFYKCALCNRIYWKGSHYYKMLSCIEAYRHC